MQKAEILAMFKETRALLDGHFQLTSGLHSPQYFQCAKVLQHPAKMEALCGEIARHFARSAVDVVVSPALGGIVVGQEVGRQLKVRTIFAERKDGKLQLRRGFVVERGERALVCEDVITTGGSVAEVIEIVKRSGGTVVGVGAVVDRSGGRTALENFFAAMTMDVITYDPADCPLCRRNIPVEKPGSREISAHTSD
jgi:orotate phosphoribosyltransferase